MKRTIMERQHWRVLQFGIAAVVAPRVVELDAQEQPFYVRHGVRRWRELRLYECYRAFSLSSCSALGAWNSVFVPNDFRTPAFIRKAVV